MIVMSSSKEKYKCTIPIPQDKSKVSMCKISSVGYKFYCIVGCLLGYLKAKQLWRHNSSENFVTNKKLDSSCQLRYKDDKNKNS